MLRLIFLAILGIRCVAINDLPVELGDYIVNYLSVPDFVKFSMASRYTCNVSKSRLAKVLEIDKAIKDHSIYYKSDLYNKGIAITYFKCSTLGKECIGRKIVNIEVFNVGWGIELASDKLLEALYASEMISEYRKRSIVLLANQRGNEHLLLRLLERNISILNPEVIYDLYERLIALGRLDTAIRYYELGVNPSTNELIRAASCSRFDFVTFFVNTCNIDPSLYDNWAMQYASQNGNLQIVEFLLQDSRVDPTVRGFVVFQVAIQNGHFDVLRSLLNRVSLSVEDFKVYKFILDIFEGDIKHIVDYLNSLTVPVQQYNLLAFEVACEHGELSVLNELAIHPNFKVPVFITNLHKVAKSGRTNVIERLEEINAINHEAAIYYLFVGYTARNQVLKVVDLMTRYPIDVSFHNYLALDVALENKFYEIADLILPRTQITNNLSFRIYALKTLKRMIHINDDEGFWYLALNGFVYPRITRRQLNNLVNENLLFHRNTKISGALYRIMNVRSDL
jgi:ankyrin repeat protein